MLNQIHRDIQKVVQFFSARGLEAGYLVPTETGLEKSIMDAHVQLSGYMRRTGLHDYSTQAKGATGKVFIKTWIVKADKLVETKSSLYRPETKSGDPRIWIYDLTKHVKSGNLLALFVHESDFYVVNTSADGLLETANNPSSSFNLLLDLLAGAKSKPLDDRFSEWNLRLLRSFFSEASKGEEVFLQVDKCFLDQIGQDIGGDDGFLSAVCAGPNWLSPRNSFVKSVLTLVEKRKLRTSKYRDPGDFDFTYRGVHAPAYLPYLAALVRNNTEHPRNYYDGLKADLKLQNFFGPTEMGQIESAWSDLKKWTEKNDGQFGHFELRRLGGYRRLSIPISQSILKPSDVEGLARIFVQAHIRPGLELSEDDLRRIVEEAQATKSVFTAGFEKALGLPDFMQPIRSAIRSAYTDWDGTLPAKNGSSENTNSFAGIRISSGFGVGISLAVDSQQPLCVSSRWRVPAFQDSGEFEVINDSFRWRGQFYGTEGANTRVLTGQDATFWKIAELASDSPQHFQVKILDSINSESSLFELPLKAHPLWVLVPAYDPLTGDIELIESELPGSGPAFLLAPPSCIESLFGYLDRENPAYELISASGIPQNWMLIQLVECGSLTPEQRLLPDGRDDAHPKPRSIRFIGGRSIRRGYSRMYLPYDLPVIALDAPEGAIIQPLNDVILEEEHVRLPPKGSQSNILRPLRRFVIRLVNSKSASYDFQTIAKDGSTLGRAKLRVAGLSGEIVNEGSRYHLDNLGRPAAEEGLSGAIITDAFVDSTQAWEDFEPFNLQPEELGSTIDPDELKYGAREMFLDALARSGSLDYGVARNLLQRLIVSEKGSGEPVFILLELRSLGHLEIATTQKGHIARIHAVTPTLYSLTSTCSTKAILAVTGTLCIANWKSLAMEVNAWSARRLVYKESELSPWRLLIKDIGQARDICVKIGFEYAETPCLTIANWSSCLKIFGDETFRNTMESIGSAREGAKRFNASKGLFSATPAGDTRQLWKIQDLDTLMDNLYVLKGEEGYAFTRDSRWGVWLVLDAFARWARDECGLEGVYPVPIMYEERNGTVWLPARIGMPSILERALILCNGSSPDVLMLKKYETEISGDKILLGLSSGEVPKVVTVNSFYWEMAGGNWLAYRRVPRRIAELIADKLSAVLDII